MKFGSRFGAACAAAVLALGCGFGCATANKDASGSGDERLDESSAPDTQGAAGNGTKSDACPTGTGDLVLLDARTGDSVDCVLVTIAREVENCDPGTECAQETVVKTRSTSSGHLKLPDASLTNARLFAVAEGYQQSVREPGAAHKPGAVAEIEMIPSDGFLLKLVDGEGNYLPGVTVSFKQGGEVIAQMKTNALANVWFPSRTPFAGEPVVIEAEGYPALTVNGPEELGADGHTITVRR